jgi:hypothetical protein
VPGSERPSAKPETAERQKPREQEVRRGGFRDFGGGTTRPHGPGEPGEFDLPADIGGLEVDILLSINEKVIEVELPSFRRTVLGTGPITRLDPSKSDRPYVQKRA